MTATIPKIPHFSNCCGTQDNEAYNRDTGFCSECKDNCTYEPPQCWSCETELTLEEFQDNKDECTRCERHTSA